MSETTVKPIPRVVALLGYVVLGLLPTEHPLLTDTASSLLNRHGLNDVHLGHGWLVEPTANMTFVALGTILLLTKLEGSLRWVAFLILVILICTWWLGGQSGGEVDHVTAFLFGCAFIGGSWVAVKCRPLVRAR